MDVAVFHLLSGKYIISSLLCLYTHLCLDYTQTLQCCLNHTLTVLKLHPSGVLLTLQLCPGCTPDFTGEMLYLILTEYTTLVSSLSAAHPLTTLLHIVVHKTISGKSDRYSGIVISSQATSIYMMVVKM